jgi:hypothetical protein
VCHTCFGGIAEGSLRSVREAAPPPWADLLAAALPPVPLVRDFHHLGCRVPTCPCEDVQGMASLREEDRAHVTALMEQQQAAALMAAVAADVPAEAAEAAAAADAPLAAVGAADAPLAAAAAVAPEDELVAMQADPLA